MRQLDQRLAIAMALAIMTFAWGVPSLSAEPADADEFFAIRSQARAPAAPALFVIDDGIGAAAPVDFARLAIDGASLSPQQTPEARLPRATGPRRDLSSGAIAFEPRGNTFFRAVGVSIFISAAGDLAASELALREPSVVESNPFQENRGVRIVSHIAVPAFVYWATERARKKGRDKLALLLRIGFSVAYGYATVHNVRNFSEQHR